MRLGPPGTIAHILAVPLITRAHQRHSRIRLRIDQAVSGFVLEWLRDARIDLVVLYGGAEQIGVTATPVLTEDTWFLAAAAPRADAHLPPPSDPIPFRQAAGSLLILPGQERDRLDRAARIARHELNTAIDVDSCGNIKSLVREGIGCSILPQNAVLAIRSLTDDILRDLARTDAWIVAVGKDRGTS